MSGAYIQLRKRLMRIATRFAANTIRRTPATTIRVTNKCPLCGSRPQPRKQKASGNVFLGCSNYPRCDGIVDLRLYADRVVH